jgi:hypothetical protein
MTNSEGQALQIRRKHGKVKKQDKIQKRVGKRNKYMGKMAHQVNLGL